MKKELWQEFIKWGSGFNLEAEREFEERGKPLYFHLKMFGFHYPSNYELTGKNLNKLLKQAIKDGEKSLKKF